MSELAELNPAELNPAARLEEIQKLPVDAQLVHSNLPLDWAVRVAQFNPLRTYKLLENPSEPLWALENHAWVLQLFPYSRICLARYTKLPRYIVEVLWTSDYTPIRHALAENVGVPADFLAQVFEETFHAWADAEWDSVSDSLLKNPRLPQHLIDRAAAPEGWRYHAKVALSTRVKPADLERLATSSDIVVVRHVAINLSTPTKLLRQLLKHADVHVRHHAATTLTRKGVLL